MDAVEAGKEMGEMMDLEMLEGVEVSKAVIWEVVETALAGIQVDMTVAEARAEMGDLVLEVDAVVVDKVASGVESWARVAVVARGTPEAVAVHLAKEAEDLVKEEKAAEVDNLEMVEG